MREVSMAADYPGGGGTLTLASGMYILRRMAAESIFVSLSLSLSPIGLGGKFKFHAAS